jgi:isoamylase
VQFRLPEVVGGDGWMRLLDTNLPDTQDLSRFDAGAGRS